MRFQTGNRASSRRKKQPWLSPKTLGTGLLLLSTGLMLYFIGEERTLSSSPLSRALLVPAAFLQNAHDSGWRLAVSVLDNFRAKQELDTLREEMARLQQENLELRYQLRRHEAYRDALGLPREEMVPSVAAIVLFRDNRMALSLIINRGAQDGLQVNLPVWTRDGLVGRTHKITRHHARVQPLTDPRCAIGVYVEDSSYEGILRGSEEGGHLLLTDLHLVSPGGEMMRPQPGQRVFTSGTGLVFPRNLLAGFVSDATSDKGYVVRPAVDVHSVKSVLILLNTPLREDVLPLITGE
ncbi:MAG TPA: rod shape-determining protein MreC [bacterium]|nr:rod shape-determining protein MreC [bacterium]HOL96464.1 rod shape-determining protein MreC [bacterium]HPP02030.1 rod shape-determining protein MreC [bacterium]HXK94072.1 rod shape-determining protein MreC [bacterium]